MPAGSIIIDPASSSGFSRDGREHPCAVKNRPQLRLLATMRDRVLEYLDAPTDEARTELGDLYDTYQHIYTQPLNAFDLIEIKAPNKPRRDDGVDSDGVDDETGERTTTRRRYPKLEGFRTDPSWWSVAAIETFDDDTGQAHLAPILQRPVLDNHHETWPDAAATIEAAVANSLARWHRIDADYIATQLGLDTAAVETQLVEVAYRSPVGEWELAARYLCGDVVGKLDTAIGAAATDARFERNVTALRAVQPTPLTASEITPEFGVTWLQPDDIAAFINDHDGGDVTIKYHPPTGAWSFDGWSPAGPARLRTDRHSMAEQVIRACNAKPVTVHTKIDAGNKELTVIDAEATAAEQLCRDNLTEALQVWCWAEPERATRLAGRYNTLFNRYRAEHWDGTHLSSAWPRIGLHAAPASKRCGVAHPRLR